MSTGLHAVIPRLDFRVQFPYEFMRVRAIRLASAHLALGKHALW
jgi:hypothetical protein